MTDEASDYDGLAALLDRSGSPLALTELHGGLSGVICAGGRDSALRWLSEVLDDCTADARIVGELSRQLDALNASTWTDLSGVSLEFSPLLPGDEAELAERAAGLGLWCHGFLAGLVIGGLDLVSGQADLAPELSELVGDFSEISKAGADNNESADADASEDSLMELVEFVRVGVQFIFEELAHPPVPADKRILH